MTGVAFISTRSPSADLVVVVVVEAVVVLFVVVTVVVPSVLVTELVFPVVVVSSSDLLRIRQHVLNIQPFLPPSRAI